MLGGFGRIVAAVDAFFADTQMRTDYEAASVTGYRMGRWRVTNGGPNSVTATSLTTARARSRDKRRNDSHASRVIECLVDNLIGTGIRPLWNTGDAALDEQLATKWRDWTQEADADGMDDFYGLQALAFGSMLEAGDVFGRMRTRLLDDGLTVPMQLQILESEFCPNDFSRLLPSGNYVLQGIEFGLIGDRQAYWMWRQHPQDMMLNRLTNLAQYAPAPVSAEQICHMATRRRPGQVRGIPWLVQSLIKLHELDKYDDAQLLRQQVAAMFAGYVKNITENPYPEGAGDIVDEDSPDEVVHPSMQPGSMHNLGMNEDVEFSDPPDPGNNYGEYVAHQERRIAAATGITYEQLTGDYSKMNDRTYRASVSEVRRGFTRLQKRFVFQGCRPVLNRWIDLGILAGVIDVPATMTPQDLKRVEWIPQAWDYINPVQDVQAKILETRAGFKSRSRQIIEGGSDPAKVAEEYRKDNDAADADQMAFDSDARYTDEKGKAQNASGAPAEGDTPA